MRLLAVVAIGFLCLVRPAVAQGPDGPPAFLLGAFVDDYGAEYVITEESWSQGSSEYHVVAWDAGSSRVLARNADSNPTEAGLWSRFEWIKLDPGSEYEWAYCHIVYDGESREEARSKPPANRAEPRSGCNGHPFTRMKRLGVG